MPLLDHFHPPLSIERPWEGIHSTWASTIATQLNQDQLPAEYFAMPLVTLAGRVQVDAGAGHLWGRGRRGRSSFPDGLDVEKPHGRSAPQDGDPTETAAFGRGRFRLPRRLRGPGDAADGWAKATVGHRAGQSSEQGPSESP